MSPADRPAQELFERIMQRLLSVERRLDRVEGRLASRHMGPWVADPATGVVTELAPQSEAETPPDPSLPPAAPPPLPSQPAPPPAPALAPPESDAAPIEVTPAVSASPERLAALRSLTHAEPNPEPPLQTGPAVTTLPPPPIVPPRPPADLSFFDDASTTPPPSQPVDERSFESVVGGRWFAVLGALAVTIAIGLFFKLAYDRGFFARIPAEARCGLGAGFGVLLLVLGELARRKINAWASAGITAAGVATLYTSVLAAYGLYRLISDPVAFALLATISLLGVAVAARARLASVAILSIIGAYLTPFLLHTHEPDPLVLPTYLVALLALGLVLGAWLRGAFRAVSALTGVGTLVLGSLWAYSTGLDHPVICMGFTGLAWVLVHFAHVVATRPDLASEAGRAESTRNPPLAESIMLGSSFGFTTWAVGLSVWALRQSGLAPEWLPPYALAAATLLLSHILVGARRLLSVAPLTVRERLGAALVSQTGALLIAGVALSASGNAAVIVWIALSLAALIAGRRFGALGLQGYGILTLVIGTGRLLGYDSWNSTLPDQLAEFAGLIFSWWMALAASAGLAWFGAAALLLPDRKNPHAQDELRRQLASAAATVGMAVLMTSVMHAGAVGASVATAWILLGVASAAIGLNVRAIRFDSLGLLALGAASVRLILIDSWFAPTPGPRYELLGLVLTYWTLAVSLAATAWLGLGVLTSLANPRDRFGGVCGFAATALFMLAACEHGAQGTSILWVWIGVGAAALLGSPLRPMLRLAWAGAASILLSLLWWFVLYVARTHVDWTGSSFGVLAHPGLWSALLLAGVLLALVRWRRVEFPAALQPVLAIGAPILAVVLTWAATSLEAGRIGALISGERTTQLASVSIWWGVFACGLIGVGFWRGLALMRGAGLGLMAVAALKVVIIDMHGVDPVWRVASFLLLGLLMLAIAAAYGKLSTPRRT